MLYVFYITTTPYLPCNNNNINRKELYDFYYTAITLTTGYRIHLVVVHTKICTNEITRYTVFTKFNNNLFKLIISKQLSV